jgi:two-component system sensor histidine kinase BarA
VAFSFALLGSLLSAIFAIRLIKKVTKPINSMVQANKKQQYELLRDAARGLQGSAASVGAGIVQKLCKTLSHATSKMLDHQAEQLIIDIEHQMESVQLAYRRYCKKGQSSVIKFPDRR